MQFAGRVNQRKPIMPTEDPKPVANNWTNRTRDWFDQRYSLISEGIYFPHQPIYGYSLYKEHLGDFLRAYNILRVMEWLPFSSFLDVGSAEGYFPNMVRYLFGAPSYGCDFAWVGVRNARQIYGIPGVVSDAHALPFKDKSIDLVLCSEVLEHVVDPELAIAELERVCSKYLIITTPAARNTTQIDQHFKRQDPNELSGHIHFFTEPELKKWLGPKAIFKGCIHQKLIPVFSRMANGPELSGFIRDFYKFMLANCPDVSPHTKKSYLDAMHAGERRSLLNRVASPSLLKAMIFLDHYFSKLFPGNTAEFLIVKCEGGILPKSRRRRHRLLDYLLVQNRVDPQDVRALVVEDGHLEKAV
jgi:SAM-dependent methyltransferase